MQIPHYALTLNVNAQNSSQTIVAKQHDDKSRYVDITLVADNKSIVLNKERVTLTVADCKTKETIALTDCSIVDGIIVAELTANILAVATTLDCEITVYGTQNEVITSARFKTIVDKKLSTEVVERENDFSALQQALSDVASTSNRIDEVSTRTQPINLGGTGATTAYDAAQALHTPFIAVSQALTGDVDLNTLRTAGTYDISSTTTVLNAPFEEKHNYKLYVVDTLGGGKLQFVAYPAGNTKFFVRVITQEGSEGEWQDLITKENISKLALRNYSGADYGKIRSDGTTHRSPEMIWGTDYDDLNQTGLYIIRGNADFPTQNAPNSNNEDNVFHILVLRYNSVYIKQVAFNVRSDSEIYMRSFSTNKWSSWQKISGYLPKIAEKGTWTPTPVGDATFTVDESKYYYNGGTVTVEAKLTLGESVTNYLSIAGLPIALNTNCNVAGGGFIFSSTGTINVVAIGEQKKITIRSAETLANKTIAIGLTYIL